MLEPEPEPAEGRPALALVAWAQRRAGRGKGQRQRRQAATLARDTLALLGGLRSSCLLDSEHGPPASNAALLLDFLAGAEEHLGALAVLAVTLGPAAAVDDPGEAFGADALFLVHRERLAARCAGRPAGEGDGDGDGCCEWGGTALVDASSRTGGGAPAPRLCYDAAVRAGLRCGTQAVGAALEAAAAAGCPCPCAAVRIDPAVTSPTLLTAWLLEYPVGYHVAQ